MPDDPRYLTADGAPITNGARLFNYYDRKWVTVTYDGGELSGPGGPYWDGWFLCRCDGGGTTLLNGERLAATENKL